MQSRLSVPAVIQPVRRAILWAVLALMAVAGARTLDRTVELLESDRIYQRDFIQEYVLPQALRAGENPYRSMGELATEFLGHLPSPYVRRHPSAHPPPVAIAFLPITLIPFKYASFLWFLIEVGGLLVCTRWLAASFGVGGLGTYCLLTLAVLGLPPVASEIMQGQLGVVALLLLLGAWRSLRSGAPLRGGAFLGGAVALKLTGWPIMLFLLLRAQWKSASAAAFVFAGLNLAAIAGMGFRRVLEYYFQVAPSIAMLYRDESANLSLWTVGWRLFAGTGSGGLNSLRAGPLIASPWLAWEVSLFIVVVLLMAAFALAWRTEKVDDWLSVLICASVLVNPVVWGHTLILLAIPVTVVLTKLRASGYPILRVALLLGLVGVMIVPNPAWHRMALRLALEAPRFGNPARIPFAFTLLTMLPQLATIGLLALAAHVTRTTGGALDKRPAMAGIDACVTAVRE